jgi:hypothetical protein
MITNYLSPLEFIVTVKRLPNVQFFTQRTSIPSISVSPIEHPTPFKPTYETGDRLNYADLNLSFIVDENMANYIEIFNWIKGYSFPENFDQYKTLASSQNGLKSDIAIQILNSSKNPCAIIEYRDCFPTDLSEINLDTTQTDVVYPEANVTFRYNYFDVTALS